MAAVYSTSAMCKNTLNFPQNSLKASVHFPMTGGGMKS